MEATKRVYHAYDTFKLQIGEFKSSIFSLSLLFWGGYKCALMVFDFSSRHWHMTEVPLPPALFAIEGNDTHWPVRALWSILPWAHPGLDTTFEPEEHSCQMSPLSFPSETHWFFTRHHTHSATMNVLTHTLSPYLLHWTHTPQVANSRLHIVVSTEHMEKY